MKMRESSISNYPLLRGEILKALSLREWNYVDLARETGYSYDYVRSFMAGLQASEQLAKKIVDVLGLPEHLAS